MPRLRPDQYEQLLAAAAARDHLSGTGATFKLEQRLKQHYGKRHCVLTSNATTAMLATGLATDLRGKEVLASPLSWGGSIGAWSILGNTFTLGMVEPDSLNLDWRSIKHAASKRTAAILATDQFGTAHDQHSLRREADRHGLLYISDAASSLGAFDGDGRPASSLADVLVVSFGSGKGITVGEGGAVLTNDDAIYERLMTCSQHPERQRKEQGGHNEFTPLAARMHPLAADILLNTFDLQMDRLRDRQREVHAFIAQHQDRLSTLPFPTPVASTYFDLSLHGRQMDDALAPLSTPLAFIQEQPQMSGSEVSFRVAPRIAGMLEKLREERYMKLADLMKQ